MTLALPGCFSAIPLTWPRVETKGGFSFEGPVWFEGALLVFELVFPLVGMLSFLQRLGLWN